MTPYIIRSIRYSNFHSCLEYGIILWGGDSECNNIFKLQKKALRIISGVSCHMSCRQILTDYNILTLSSLYILEVIYFIKTCYAPALRQTDQTVESRDLMG
jgi:hypothetical protein